MPAKLNDVIQLLRVRCEIECGEDLRDEPTHRWKRERLATTVAALALQKGVGDGREYDVAVPALIGSTLEVIEPEFVLQVLILLFDRPALMRQRYKSFDGDSRRQIDEEVARDRRAADGALREQPHLGQQMAAPPTVSRRHAQRCEVGGPPRRLLRVVPGDPP